MQIVFVIFCLQGNGAERVVITLAEEMQRQGHDVSIVLFKNTIELPVAPSIRIHQFPYKFLRFLPKQIRTRLVAHIFDTYVKLKFGKPDLILSNLLPIDQVLTHSRLDNIHFVIHNNISQERLGPTPSQNEIEKTLRIYHEKSCIAVSQGVENDLRYLNPEIDCRTIYNPVDQNFIDTQARKFTPKHDNYIVCVGKFKRAKRQDRLIRAFANLNSKHNLVFVGRGENKYLKEAKQLTKELNLEKRVHFVGFQENPFPYIKQADLLVVSSDFEGLGMTILEAITLGTPVVSTDCPSGPSEILPEYNLVDVDDLDGLTQKIDEALDGPSKFRVPLDQKFTAEYAAQKYLDLAKKAND